MNTSKDKIPDKVAFAAQVIQAAQKKAGDNEISKEEAKLLVPFLVIIFADFAHLPLTYGQVASRILYVSGDPTDEGRMMGNRESPAVNGLKKDYPDLRFTSDEEMRISLSLINHLVLSFTFMEKIYIYLDKLNDFKTDPKVVAAFKEKDQTQDEADPLFIPAMASTPFILLASALIHEFCHFQADRIDPLPVDVTWADGISKISKVDEVKRATTSGFRIHYNLVGDVLMTMDGFEEFFADYLTSKICQKYHLEYTIDDVDYLPQDFKLFDEVIKQAGITIPNLLNYQRKNQSEELFSRITRRDFAENQLNPRDVFTFAVALFLSFNQGAWKDMLTSLLPQKKD